MTKHEYCLNEVCVELDVSPTYLLELRRKLNINRVDEEAYVYLKRIVSAIRKRYGRVTLTTINQYMRYQNNE